jgi:hypothetical protein
MNTILRTVLLVILTALPLRAQQTAFEDSLLDRMTGNWLMQGTIEGKETTHDVVVEWVLGHEYLRIREVSHEKNTAGEAMYEAIVFIGWDRPSGKYACLWLDNTGGGGLSAQAVGYAKRRGDEIPFLFKGSDGSLFHTTFVYQRGTDAWQWLMDCEEKGKLEPFSRVKLTRK